MCGGDEAILGFLDFFGSVYLVVIFVWVWEISEHKDLSGLLENARWWAVPR